LLLPPLLTERLYNLVLHSLLLPLPPMETP
jgi:hypothetical protein